MWNVCTIPRTVFLENHCTRTILEFVFAMSTLNEGWNNDLLSVNPRRIMIVRLNGTTETMATLPLLIALRTRYPRAEIAWLMEDKNAPLLYGHIALDRLIIANRNWVTSLEELRLLRKRLMAFSPEVTIDLDGVFKSAFAAWLSGAGIRIGFGKTKTREGSPWLNNIKVDPEEQHIVDRNLELLKPLGVHGCSVEFELPECESDRFVARRIRSDLNMEGNYALIHVGADCESKLWRPRRYGQLCRYLSEQWNLPTMVLGSTPSERDMAIQTVNASDGTAELAPDISLTELASISRMATIFIGSDSGPLHVAATVGTPCVGLFGPSSGLHTGPYGRNNRIVQRMVADPRIKPQNVSRELMDAIELEHVTGACDEILEMLLENETRKESIPFPPSESEQKKKGA